MPTVPDKDEEAANPANTIVLVAFAGVEAIDVAGPASVFSKAEALRPGSYRLRIASPSGGTVATNAGLSLPARSRCRQLTGAIDTLVVAGGDEWAVRAAIVEHRVGAWLTAVAPSIRRIASVCSGAFALAAAGLLDGREATTHWRVCDQLQALRPQVRVQRERIYVHDGPLWTSAGVTTGIELALALVEDDLGHAVSMEIARTLALPMLRGAGQPQLSQALRSAGHGQPPPARTGGWIGTHPQEDLSVEALAERVQMSPRHFARAFAAQAGSRRRASSSRPAWPPPRSLLRETLWTQDRSPPHRLPFGRHIAACFRPTARHSRRRAYRERERDADRPLPRRAPVGAALRPRIR